MTKERKKFQPLTSENICQVYRMLYKEGFVAFPETGDSKFKVEALVESITGASFGKDHYESPKEKVVAYLYFLIKNHPFVDGNKRTACLSFSIVCELNKLSPKFKGFSLDELAVLLEQSKMKDYHGLIKAVADLLFMDKSEDGL